jgi:hypothetical protein
MQRTTGGLPRELSMATTSNRDGHSETRRSTRKTKDAKLAEQGRSILRPSRVWLSRGIENGGLQVVLD